MHSKSIGHLGLTPLDVLFSKPGGSEIKICDFSLSRRIVGIVKMEYGQPEYVSPEIVNGEGASFAADLWAVGIITYLLLSGVSPFRGQVSSKLGMGLSQIVLEYGIFILVFLLKFSLLYDNFVNFISVQIHF